MAQRVNDDTDTFGDREWAILRILERRLQRLEAIASNPNLVRHNPGVATDKLELAQAVRSFYGELLTRAAQESTFTPLVGVEQWSAQHAENMLILLCGDIFDAMRDLEFGTRPATYHDL